MPNINTIEVTAPASWASYLINDDSSGLSDDELESAKGMIDAIVSEHGRAYVVDCSDAEFMWYPDYGMAGDCCTYTIQV